MMKHTLRWIFRAMFCEDSPSEGTKSGQVVGVGDEVERWERGFRAIVTRIHGARKEFDIPMVVDKVDTVYHENARLRAAIAPILTTPTRTTTRRR